MQFHKLPTLLASDPFIHATVSFEVMRVEGHSLHYTEGESKRTLPVIPPMEHLAR